jgi:hypothetical protein
MELVSSDSENFDFWAFSRPGSLLDPILDHKMMEWMQEQGKWFPNRFTHGKWGWIKLRKVLSREVEQHPYFHLLAFIPWLELKSVGLFYSTVARGSTNGHTIRWNPYSSVSISISIKEKMWVNNVSIVASITHDQGKILEGNVCMTPLEYVK